MASYIATVADAVKSAINGATLSQSVTAIRVYEPRFTDLGSSDTVQVLVIPRQCPMTPLSRQYMENDIQIDVGVMKHLGSTTDPSAEAANTAIDAMLQLTEEIANIFSQGSFGGAAFASATIDPIYDAERMNANRVFLSVINLLFKYTS